MIPYVIFLRAMHKIDVALLYLLYPCLLLFVCFEIIATLYVYFFTWYA